MLPHLVYTSFLHIAPDRIAKAMILQETRPQLKMICTVKIRNKTHKPTKLRFKKKNLYFFPLMFHLPILIPTWPNLLITNLDILPRPCQDAEKGQEPPTQVLAISGLLLLSLNFPSITTEAF